MLYIFNCLYLQEFYAIPKQPSLIPEATDRIETLSKPKRRADNEEFFRDVVWPVPSESESRPTSQHTKRLAKPKYPFHGFQYPRSCIWDFSHVKKPRYRISDRAGALSAPKTRSETTVKLDPFGVSKAALNAKLSKRLEELSVPVPNLWRGLSKV